VTTGAAATRVPPPLGALAFRALDAVYTARNRVERNAYRLLRQVTTPSTSNYDRLGAAARWIDVCAPSVMARIQRAIHRVDLLPFLFDRVEPLGFGKGSTCVVLRGRPDRVLKILRRSLGKDPPALSAMVGEMRADYETLCRWYVGVPGLLPETSYLVLHSPLRGVAAAACVQTLIEPPMRDLLSDYQDQELADLMARFPEFGARVREFARATGRMWREEHRFLDLIGSGNVVVVWGPSGPDLRVIDLGIMDLEGKRRSAPRVFAQATRILERLESLAREGPDRLGAATKSDALRRHSGRGLGPARP
jgi:hypothetical protein